VFIPVDIEKGEGPELAKKLEVEGVPHFLLTNSDGAVLDRWTGYRNPQDFIPKLESAVADPTTFEEKLARYAKAPTAADAARLARIYDSRGDSARTIELYLEAQKLDKEGALDLAQPLFEARANAFLAGEGSSLEEVQASADAALGSKSATPASLIRVARYMASISSKAEKPQILAPYLIKALEASEGTTDEKLQKSRKPLLVLKALHVDGDKDKALALKRESLPENWQQEAVELNRFAWWCFENNVNLEEAEALARKGVELAKPGTEKAMILDTLAEICNARGSCEDAVKLIEQAVKEDPGNEYYAKQLKRFQDLLAQKND
jgi:tetratricopeptide (TPR) repeat protein